MPADFETVLSIKIYTWLIFAFSVSEITLGAVFLDDCPASPILPVYVMVCGIMGILLLGLINVTKYLGPSVISTCAWIWCLLMLCLLTFIYGSYLVYSIYPPNYIKSSNSSSVYDVSAADLKPEPYNQTQNPQSLNQTGTIYHSNQTLLNLIQTLSRNSSAQVNREHLMTALTVEAAAPHCNRNLYQYAYGMISVVLWVIIGVCCGFLCQQCLRPSGD